MIKQRIVVAGLVLGLAATAGVAQPAQAGVGVGLSVFGAMVYPQKVSDLTTSDGVSGSLSPSLGFGGGALFSLRFNPYLGLETGAAYLMRKYTATASATIGETTISSESALTAKSIYIPLGIRIHLNRVISFQAGGFYDLSAESGGGATYGVDGGLRLSLPLGQSVALFVEGRYDYSLKTEEINGASVKLHDLVNAFAGLTFGGGFGGK